jgi:hypothetical protein
MLQRVDEAFTWLPGEIREDCAVIWRVFEALSARDLGLDGGPMRS